MKERGEISPPAPGAPDYALPDTFWERAEAVYPERKTPVSLRVDPDVLEWFKAQGPGHLTRMQAVLRAYVEAKRKQDGAKQG
ncbi:BrnA antitoxin family protein [Roseicyclus sp.]|uniref:BrnA antitoxin family protein n=1 Tax=Roseicyclus sp. TaxID=1914329 RepID=UPI001BD06258|nr:BrnA antitoxin family protein [Roseicyclus sp.]